MNSDSVASGATAAQPSAPGGLARRFPNDKLGRRALRNWLRRHGVSRAVFEPDGRYHRRLHQCLAAALGLLVKANRVDAKVLARYGRLEGLEATAPLDPSLAQLQDLVLMRRRFVDECASLGRLEQELESKAALRQLHLQRQAVECRVKALDKDLLQAIEADDGLRRRAQVLRSIPGVGAVTAATLLADMPELGTLGRRAAGALLGVAPCARDSGSHVGRAEPRNALYMAALTAIRRNPPLATFYKRLRDRGKQPKLALVAVMRKLVALADALLRANRLWQASAPCTQVPA